MAYERKLEKDIRCPLEYGMALFGGKWKSRILCVLAGQGTLRYSALRKQMGNITDAVLAAALKELLADDMIQRKSYDEIPPGGIRPIGKRPLCDPDLAEHLPMGRWLL